MVNLVGSPQNGNSKKPVRIGKSGFGGGGVMARKSPQSRTGGVAKVSVLFPGNGFKSICSHYYTSF